MSDAERAARIRALGGDPPRLPLSVAARVAWTSIRVRFSRSLVTVSSVVLAVAFLLVVSGDNLCSRSVHRKLREQSLPAEDAMAVQEPLSGVRRPLTLARLLADRTAQAKLMAWASGLGVQVPACASDAAADVVVCVDWIAALKVVDRFKILGTGEPMAWILALRSEEQADQFQSLARTFRGVRLPRNAAGGLIDLRGLSRQTAGVADAIQFLEQAERQRLAQVAAAGGARTVVETLAATRGTPAEADAALTGLGLPLAQVLSDLDQGRLNRLRAQVAMDLDRQRANQVLEAWYKEHKAGVKETDRAGRIRLRDVLSGAVVTKSVAPVRERLEEAIGKDGMARLSAEFRQRQEIDALQAVFLDLGFDPSATGERSFWLVVLSLLVCIVGIVNSMMMAVTERFVEIATMKCLGAVDGFIIKAFLIESAVIGLCGAVAGAILGLLVALGQASFRFGASLWPSLPAQELAIAVLAALGCGLVLTVVGALLPAYKAARMQPIEAMRFEQ